MPTDHHLAKIEERAREIAKEIARLQEESNEIAVTLKVIRRFDTGVPSVVPASEKEVGLGNSEYDSKLGPPRPSGCPTNYEMVDFILSSAEKEGKDGLTIAELISEMGKRYWPGLKIAQVSAPIYSMARRGRFKKTASGKFKRVKKSEDSTPISADEKDASTWSS